MNSLIKFLPKNHLSAIIGRIAYFKLPFNLSKFIIYWFIDRYRVDISEIDGELADYETLGQFFTRRLKSGSRPIGRGVVSPVDGKIVQCGVLECDRLLQVKGKYYYLDGLLRDGDLVESFYHGYYITVYLSPSDYHRIHAPCSGTITDSYLIEGNLWPVNNWSAENIDNLFSVNERVTTLVQCSAGRVAIVKVGATNVGSISVSYDTFRTNKDLSFFGERDAIRHRSYNPPVVTNAGDELGVFNLGSTVILLFQRDSFLPNERCVVGTDLKMGESIGEFK